MIKTWSTPVIRERREAKACPLCGENRFKRGLDCEGFSFVRCRRCGLLQSNPQPTTEAIEERYGKAHGTDYLSYELQNEDSFLHLQKLALRDAEIEGLETAIRNRGKVPKVLDVGCATGALLAHLKLRGWDTAGVELSEQQASWARGNRDLDIRTSTLEAAAFPDSSFDLVHASHLIEHLNDPRSFVAEAHRVLARSGVLLVTTPNADGLQARLFGRRWRSAIFDHLFLFSKRTLTTLLESEGFTIEKSVTWGGLAAGIAPKPVKTLVDRTAKRFGFGDVVLLKARKR